MMKLRKKKLNLFSCLLAHTQKSSTYQYLTLFYPPSILFLTSQKKKHKKQQVVLKLELPIFVSLENAKRRAKNKYISHDLSDSSSSIAIL